MNYQKYPRFVRPAQVSQNICSKTLSGVCSLWFKDYDADMETIYENEKFLTLQVQIL